MKKQIMLEQMEHICEEYILEAKQTAGRKRRSSRVLRAALIAACACVVLIGGAFAVTELIVEPVDVEIDKEKVLPSNGGQEEVYDGYTTEPEEVQNFPMDSFSETIRQLDGTITDEMLTLGAIRYEFDSWNEMEEFLGIDLMNNAALEAYDKKYQYDRVLDRTKHCSLSIFPRLRNNGEIARISSAACYVADRGVRTDGTEYEVLIALSAILYTEHEKTTGITGTYYYEGTEFEIFEYTLSGGEVVEIAWVDTRPEDYADHPTKITDHYDVSFAINGVNYFLTCSASDEEKAETLEILKTVLDSFR